MPEPKIPLPDPLRTFAKLPSTPDLRRYGFLLTQKDQQIQLLSTLQPLSDAVEKSANCSRNSEDLSVEGGA